MASKKAVVQKQNGNGAKPLERIPESDAAYMRQLAAEVQQAQALYNSWGAELVRRYGLGPGDQITPDGSIVRAPLPQGSEAEERI